MPSPEPRVIEVQSGEHYDWCRCARSQTPPFCDGARHGEACRPLRYTATACRLQWFCTCQLTTTPPFCDGRSHHRAASPREGAANKS